MRTNSNKQSSFDQFSPEGRLSIPPMVEPSRGCSEWQPLRALPGPILLCSLWVHKPCSHTCQLCKKRIFSVEYYMQKQRSTVPLKKENLMLKASWNFLINQELTFEKVIYLYDFGLFKQDFELLKKRMQMMFQSFIFKGYV